MPFSGKASVYREIEDASLTLLGLRAGGNIHHTVPCPKRAWCRGSIAVAFTDRAAKVL